MEAEKARIRFFIDRWGNSPAIFAYDVLNEIHPHWGGTPDEQHAWVAEMARFIKSYEMERWGKRHLLTLSVFGSKPEGGYIDLIFRHPELDFATTHVYEFGVVDNPDNTVDGALVMRDAVRYAYANMTVPRPYTDTESGPIHLYMDLKRSLPDAFEEEYYHNMCWAHLASGGAGSGMRWPFRDPHCLSPQMHAVQLGMAQFLPAIEWTAYSPQPIEQMLQVVSRTSPGCDCHAVPLRDVLPFGCSDGRQALIWLLRDCRLEEAAQEKRAADLLVPCLHPGEYHAEFWETYSGTRIGEHHFRVGVEPGSMPPGGAQLPLPDFDRDVAVAIRPAHD